MTNDIVSGYELSRIWFDWCFENPEKITPTHTALYFFIIEHCNRMGWKEKFGLPTTMAKEAIGIRSYNTYINALNDLVSFGFVKMIERSKNQYSSNIVALSYFDKALNKALDKALIKHGTKQRESIDSINKQETRNNKQIESETNVSTHQTKSKDLRELEFSKNVSRISAGLYPQPMIEAFVRYWTESNEGGRKMRFEMQKTFDIARRLTTWASKEFNSIGTSKQNNEQQQSTYYKPLKFGNFD